MMTIYAGLSVGAIYALIAIGYNLAYLAAGVINFTQGYVVMFASFFAYTGLREQHWPVVAVLLACAAIGATVNIVIERVAIRPIRGRGAHGELITTVGAATVLAGAATVIWGTDPLPVPLFGHATSWHLMGGLLRPESALLVAAAVVAGVAAHVWARHTRTGLASLAQSEDPEAAMLRGVNVRALSLIAFAGAGALAGAIAPLVGAKTFAVVDLAPLLAVKGFVVLALGGIGNQLGAVLGGLVLGLLESYAARWLGAEYQNLTVFVVFLTVLLIRPTGLMGVRTQRVV